MTEAARTLAYCAGALLDQGRIVDRLSRRVTATALILVLISLPLGGRPSAAVVGMLLLIASAGFAEAYCAVRVAFDAALFHRAASAPEGAGFVEIDAALTRLGLLPSGKDGRAPEVRVAGARRLFTFQIAAMIVQALIVIAAAGLVLMGI